MYVLQRADAEKSPCSWHEVTESVCPSCPGRRDSTKATVRVHNLGVHDGMMTRCGQLGYGRWLREGAAPVVPSPPLACLLRRWRGPNARGVAAHRRGVHRDTVPRSTARHDVRLGRALDVGRPRRHSPPRPPWPLATPRASAHPAAPPQPHAAACPPSPPGRDHRHPSAAHRGRHPAAAARGGAATPTRNRRPPGRRGGVGGGATAAAAAAAASINRGVWRQRVEDVLQNDRRGRLLGAAAAGHRQPPPPPTPRRTHSDSSGNEEPPSGGRNGTGRSRRPPPGANASAAVPDRTRRGGVSGGRQTTRPPPPRPPPPPPPPQMLEAWPAVDRSKHQPTCAVASRPG